ncbi:hypothetical protein FNV43_RR08395 [Rhamnella rubrinervis]|uniref:Uncharacterized protein n=1 Tax=Rhamnella rubrinervis TaxID=2594499 RepID=A0A8K0H852_9ROSA|nr:hypothetical protein FNV43_RR08395 [Rhamnella rubrinervis]
MAGPAYSGQPHPKSTSSKPEKGEDFPSHQLISTANTEKGQEWRLVSSHVRKELASKLEEHDVFVRGCGERDEGKGGRTHHSKASTTKFEVTSRYGSHGGQGRSSCRRCDGKVGSCGAKHGGLESRVGDQWRNSMATSEVVTAPILRRGVENAIFQVKVLETLLLMQARIDELKRRGGNFVGLGVMQGLQLVVPSPLNILISTPGWMKDEEMRKGTCIINSWEDLKHELKKQFYHNESRYMTKENEGVKAHKLHSTPTTGIQDIATAHRETLMDYRQGESSNSSRGMIMATVRRSSIKAGKDN